jgi:hypothetical protein
MKTLKGGLATGTAMLVGLLLSAPFQAQTASAEAAAASKLTKRLVGDYG